LFSGLAGFATLTLVPGLGLSPQVTGTEAAPLAERQLWWVATAAATGTSLALSSFARPARWAMLAAVLMVLPHLCAAPQPMSVDRGPLEGLAHQFAVAVTIRVFCLG